jgi:hypothetical protein
VFELFASGRIADLILGLMLIEGVVLFVYNVTTSRGIAPVDLLTSLLAGVFLILALRFALVGAGWEWVALSLAAALVAHLADLSRRWRR